MFVEDVLLTNNKSNPTNCQNAIEKTNARKEYRKYLPGWHKRWYKDRTNFGLSDIFYTSF